MPLPTCLTKNVLMLALTDFLESALLLAAIQGSRTVQLVQFLSRSKFQLHVYTHPGFLWYEGLAGFSPEKVQLHIPDNIIIVSKEFRLKMLILWFLLPGVTKDRALLGYLLMRRMNLAHNKGHGLFWVLAICPQSSQILISHSSWCASHLWADLKEPKAKPCKATVSQDWKH